MANAFTFTLVIITMLTGVIWCVNRFKAVFLKRYIIKKLHWIETISSVFPVLAIVVIIRSFIFEPFHIPSGSMMPTLLIGDFILVEKFAYGIKEPLTQTTLMPTGHPKRGDIVVFKYPKNTKVDYIKRIIGLPGDRIVFNPYNKTLTINADCNKNGKYETVVPITYTKIEPSLFIQTFSEFGNNENQIINGYYEVPKDKTIHRGLRLSTREETLDHVKHHILLLNELPSQANMYYQQVGQPLSTWIVPKGQYFMMGDNRDNSADSRYWGFVPEKNLLGKVVAIWMSFDKKEGQWPTGIRLNRIGSIH
ncbi:signal peptidase I [Candidatus Pantoea carbekii]|uniref:Signal peptidase I n=1 Tax=Candidatus Pantoea carbekii TaxID=1235990 RepID=U3U9C4_9GAMM|nr:signal peptidase I [Candidatus Pantoea carbekii]AKC31874.1 signal peptidase I LepB [Candidatus Pantoea carbekii]BAO00388.1 signal peptidase I [Candidatus Pantoea carbekii]